MKKVVNKRKGVSCNPQEIDWESVKKLSAMQCTRDEIAAFLCISYRTLLRAAKREFNCDIVDLINEWKQGGKVSLRRKQWLLADKSTAMAIFLGKQILGQRDDVRLNHTGQVTQEIIHYGDGMAKTWEQENSGI